MFICFAVANVFDFGWSGGGCTSLQRNERQETDKQLTEDKLSIL